MIKTNLRIVFVLGLSLILRAEACTEEKTIDLVFGADFVATIQSSQGWTEANDSDMVSVAVDEEMLDALSDVDIDGTITSINVNGAHFEMLTNDGHDARRNGSVFMSINGGAELKLLDWNTPNNQPGTMGYASNDPIDPATPSIRFNPAGLAALNLAMDSFLANYNGGIQPNPLAVGMRATWASTPAPTAQEPDNFSWEATILVQLTQDAVLDVPNF
jgi:hypothetical protein